MGLGEAFTSRTGTTYVVVHEHVPRPEALDCFAEKLDAFVAILDGARLTDDIADRIAAGLVALPTDWVETMGVQSESLHDRIDAASVEIARQRKVGDGDPMTAWHEDMLDLHAMVDWTGSGGHGGTDYKLVVVVGPEESAHKFEASLRQRVGA